MSDPHPDFALNRKRGARDEYAMQEGAQEGSLATGEGMMEWDSSKGATVDGVARSVTANTRKQNALVGAARSGDSNARERAGQAKPGQARLVQASNAFSGAGDVARVAAIQAALAAAVERWWQASLLPSDVLLRDGLLALEAGVDLEASQRTLLARTALARQRGVITGLRHVNDPARMASLVHEAWSNVALDEQTLAALLRDKRLGSLWQRTLTTDLRADLPSFVPAVAARAALGLRLIADQLAAETGGDGGGYTLTVDGLGSSRRWVLWLVALGIVLALAAWAVLQPRTPDFGDVVTVPASLHTVTDAAGASAMQALDGYVIERTEVTNAAYRACYAAGVCPFPVRRAAAERDDYFLDDNYANYPVVNVAWVAADTYCAWRSMRLPTAAEFEVAARFAPLTNRYYRYPWGDGYASAFVVDSANFAATAEVGARSPHGDSPIGVADLAGNVAEWTSTLVADAPQMALVKGGSYREQEGRLQPALSVPMLKTAAEEWLGFRCAATVPP